MMLIGTFVIYAIGLPWLSASRHLSTNETIANGLAPFVVWDLEAGRRGRDLPRRLVAHRPPARRPLTSGLDGDRLLGLVRLLR